MRRSAFAGSWIKWTFLGVVVIVLVLFLNFKRPQDNAGLGNILLERCRADQQDILLGADSSQTQKRHRILESLWFKDTWDEYPASAFLAKYKKILAKNNGPNADPKNHTTITEWWQAAAMIDWYFKAPLRYTCKKKVAYGNWHVCQDPEVEVKPPCLVYSFGINNEFSFDDAMGHLGCEVHSFDPSMGQEGYKRSKNVTFYNLGLGSHNTDTLVAQKDIYVKDHQLWKMRTLKRVTETLGHENRVIDVLKIDIETHEWGVVDNILETGMFDHVRQLLLEFHLMETFPAREEYVNNYNVLRRMKEYGFRGFAANRHTLFLRVKDYRIQSDCEFVNARYLTHPGTLTAMKEG